MADTVAVHGALDGDERSVLVGHDWGAIATSGLGRIRTRRSDG